MEVGLQVIKIALENASVRIHEAIANHVGPRQHSVQEIEEELSHKEIKVNISGDTVLALDMLADKILENELRNCSVVAGFASEEREDFVVTNPNGEYIIVFDPLDGSQNVKASLSVGAIYGIFKKTNFHEITSGQDLVAAGYALFSSALTFAFCTLTSPLSFSQYDFENRIWAEYETNHKQPSKGKTYAINEGNSANWDPTIQAFIANHMRGKRSVRWMCCMVADVHRQLIEGGCFIYPRDRKYPDGRLRLLYEAIPLAFVWERSGKGVALATTEGERILDIMIPHDDVHVRCGVIYLGEDEAKQFERVKALNPTWAGGQISYQDRKALKEDSEEKSGLKSEISLLRGAVIVGVIAQLALMYRNYNN